MSKLNYKTSKDYKRLKELLDKGESVIVVWKDVLYLRPFIAHKDFMPGRYHLGIGGFPISEETDFEDFCCMYGLEFIEPNGEE